MRITRDKLTPEEQANLDRAHEKYKALHSEVDAKEREWRRAFSEWWRVNNDRRLKISKQDIAKQKKDSLLNDIFVELKKETNRGRSKVLGEP